MNTIMIRKYVAVSLIVLISIIQFSCKKYLDVRRTANQAVPSSLKDMQAILDNQYGNNSAPSYLEFVADNHYLSDANWAAEGLEDRLSYIWDKDALVRTDNWSRPYEGILNVNLVLDYLPRIGVNASEQGLYNTLKGTALFYRSYIFYQLAQLFCKPYSSSSSTDPGIILRMTSAIAVPSVRATVQQTYEQIINDLKASTDLLPNTSLFSTRPTKAAAYAMLARVYLSMRDYSNAATAADQCLSQRSTLLNYNTLTNSTVPEFTNNPEMLFLSSGNHSLFGPGFNHIDSTLYKLYNVDDLRATVFFGTNNQTHFWLGSYMIPGVRYSIFDGLATDEIYLVRAECRARAGDKDNAMADLNTLLHNRWKTGQFTDLVASSPEDALAQILVERRKELLYRGLRWTDLRRLNIEGANITLTRKINGNIYQLPPNDLRWVLLIPAQEIIQSGVAQNPR
jgi:tetratricopeptide (TPR) repeat protein